MWEEGQDVAIKGSCKESYQAFRGRIKYAYT